MRKQRTTEAEFTMLPLRATIPTSHDPSVLPVNCWCERRLLLVPKPRVLAGRTGSCGRRDCREP